MIVWPDQWYHTSADTPDKSDATQFKRVVAISAAAGEFLANAGPAEASRIMAEISARQGGRLGDDRARAELRLRAAPPGGALSADLRLDTLVRSVDFDLAAEDVSLLHAISLFFPEHSGMRGTGLLSARLVGSLDLETMLLALR